LIDRAEQEIDFAAYAPTDWPVMQALTRAADRGVNVRVYLKYAIRGEAIGRPPGNHRKSNWRTFRLMV
jgi:phosphatidylserine/phosphatidylglycerophosphate/cardiolipin synthase-like enzyme